MKKLKLILLLSFVITLSLNGYNAYQKSKGKENQQQVHVFSTYEKEWKRADSLQTKGLTKSALEIVNLIYSRAKVEKSTSNFIRALIEKMKYESYTEEDSYVKAINDLETEATKSGFPQRQIIQSITAETYWRFYQNNRSVFLGRSSTSNFNNKDIRTWDLKRILEKVKQNYLLSLSEAEKLKSSSLLEYNSILITADSSKKLRPTLYDFLAHRAIDFFMNEEPELIKPAYAFEIDKSNYFDSYASFVKLKIESLDTGSLKLIALKLLQEAISFHIADKNPQALVDVDSKRLRFVLQHSTHPDKDSLYISALFRDEKILNASSASAELSYLIANYYWDQSNRSEVRENRDGFINFRKIAFQKCEQTIQLFPGSSGAINCAYLKSLLEEKSLSVTLEDGNIPNKPELFLMKYRNIRRVYFKVVRVPQKNEFDIERGISSDLQKDLLKDKGEASWQVDLPLDEDYCEHSVQLKAPALNIGHYIVFVGSDAGFSDIKNGLTHSVFWVSNLSYVTRQKVDGTYEGYLLNRESGISLQHISIQTWREDYDYNARKYHFVKGEKYNSDEKGYFLIPANDNNRTFFMEFTSPDGDRLCSDNGFYLYKGSDNEELKYTQTFFFTDRKIYRPGQTVYFKGLLIERSGKKSSIVPKQTTEVIFYDVNGQKVSSQNLVTNEFGTLNGSFIAPSGTLNGQMSISNGSGSIYVSVEEYKRPKFEIIFDALKDSYRSGDSVKINGKVVSFSGAVVDGAKVKYRIVKQAVFPNWWGYWRGFSPQSQSTEIQNGSVTTNAKGEFLLKFKSIFNSKAKDENASYYRYTVYIDVTDIDGETHSAEKSVNIGNTLLSLKLDLPANLNRDEFQKCQIHTSNLNGDFIAAKGIVRIYKLKQPAHSYKERKWEKPDRYIYTKEEFAAAFPDDLFADENNKYNWEREEIVAEINFNTDTNNSSKGMLVFDNIKNWKQGEYLWEAVSRDKYNQEVKAQDYFSVFSTKEHSIPAYNKNYFSSVQSVGEPGETAKFLIGTTEKNVQVLFEIESKNEIIKSDWISINTEQKLIEIPIEDSYRGNFSVHFTYVKNNRAYVNDAVVIVPYSNKELDLSFETFRNKLYPGQAEEWRIKIRDKNGDKVSAELLATLYDASLDAFASNSWVLNLYENYYSQRVWETRNSFKINSANAYGQNWNIYRAPFTRQYDALNWFGYEGTSYNYGGGRMTNFGGGKNGMVVMDAAPMAMEAVGEQLQDLALGKNGISKEQADFKSIQTKNYGDKQLDEKSAIGQLVQPLMRKNFNETAFFYPQLATDEKGDVLIKFNIPEALTKWKMLGLAHTKDLKIGTIERELLTQKDLMVSLNIPRFLRESDSISIAAKVSNLSNVDLKGEIELQVYDAITMQNISSKLILNRTIGTFDVKQSQSTTYFWDLKIPQTFEAITFRVSAKTVNFSDGEENTIPVLSNRMLITESLPLSIRGNNVKNFTFEKLINQNNHSNTLTNHKVTLEFTSNPAWYAIQALPYLIEYPYECSEQTFARYYANSIATYIANSSPKIKAVFDSWRNAALQGDKEAMLSNLEKNQELKTLLLQETPWLMDAKNETERRHNLSLLFDLNKMSNEAELALKKLNKMQSSNGGWPWFDGMPDDIFITEYIIAGMGHLDNLGVKKIRQDKDNFEMIRKALYYMDNRIREEYDQLLSNSPSHIKENHLNVNCIQYLYARSYFNDVEINKKNKVAFEYFQDQAAKYWLSQSIYMQGKIALSLNRSGRKEQAKGILKSIKEKSISNEELGMYWKENLGGYFWYQAPIETQSLLIEAFDEIEQDEKSVESMKIWLLKNKQTTDWKTTKATSEACYALLIRGNNWLDTDVGVELNIGSKLIRPESDINIKEEAGTGYFKTSWSGGEVVPEMGNIKVSPISSTNSTENKVRWGAMYWQYFENLDKISIHSSPLKIEKKVFIKKNAETGPIIQKVDSTTAIKIGDKLVVRIVLKVDRAMEYVHLKDMRASGLEPISVFSEYKFQDGLGYYESTGDAATNFFFSYLPKGTYVFEYSLRASQIGNFSNGVASIQCMYAPEFTGHSEGIRLSIVK